MQTLRIAMVAPCPFPTSQGTQVLIGQLAQALRKRGHQVHLVINQILFSTQPSVLLRLSTKIVGHNVDAAQKSLTEFAEEAIPVLRKQLAASGAESGK